MLEVAVVVGRHDIDGSTQVVVVRGTSLEVACTACCPAPAGVVLKLGILRHALGLSAACFHLLACY